MENQNVSSDKKDVEQNKFVALLSYLWLLCLVPLLLKPKSEFCKFHGKQGLVLCIAWLFVWIPFIGWLIWIALIILSILGILNVLKGEKNDLPVVGNLAKKLNI
jgi:uncharacterized membrane protein